MRIALIGGTGRLGRGLAMRLSNAHQVLIGSRDESRAKDAAAKAIAATGNEVTGGTNESVTKDCEMAILAVPDLDQFELLRPLRDRLADKIVISPIVPMLMENDLFRYARNEGSAAESVASVLYGSRIVAALHTVPAQTLEKLDHRLDFDVLIACDRRADFDLTAQVIGSIEGLRPLYSGTLNTSRTIEALTPLILNTAKLNRLSRLSFKLIS